MLQRRSGKTFYVKAKIHIGLTLYSRSLDIRKNKQIIYLYVLSNSMDVLRNKGNINTVQNVRSVHRFTLVLVF